MRNVPDFNNSSIKVMHINGRLLANNINWVMLGQNAKYCASLFLD